MRRLKFLGGIVLCTCLLGCDQAALMKKFVPEQDEVSAKQYVALLRQGKFDQIQRDFDPRYVDSNFRDTLAHMAAVFPDQTPESVKVVGFHDSRRDGNGTLDITLEYQFPNKWVLANIDILRTDDAATLTGFHVTSAEDSLEHLNRFTLEGKTAVQYLIFALGVGSQLFSLYAFALCIGTKVGKRKWLWALFTLVGASRLAVNWATGQWTYTLLAVCMPCFLANHPPYGPWTVAAYFPLGAVLFIEKRWRMKTAGELLPPSTPDLDGTAATS